MSSSAVATCNPAKKSGTPYCAAILCVGSEDQLLSSCATCRCSTPYHQFGEPGKVQLMWGSVVRFGCEENLSSSFAHVQACCTPPSTWRTRRMRLTWVSLWARRSRPWTSTLRCQTPSASADTTPPSSSAHSRSEDVSHHDYSSSQPSSTEFCQSHLHSRHKRQRHNRALQSDAA